MSPQGWSGTGSLADSLDTIVSSARIVRENEGVMPQSVDRQTLGKNMGLDWKEVTYDQLSAQAVTENTDLDNPQQLSDSALTITPTVIGIETFITDRLSARMTPKGLARIGSLAQNAMQRKKDLDGLVVLDGATTSLCGAGTAFAAGYISAGVTRISSNATEPGMPPYMAVLHGYQIKDIFDEAIAGFGTYALPDGFTARALQEGFKGKIANANIVEDGNISIDAADDAKGGVFAREAIVLVQGRLPRVEPKRQPQRGGGGTSFYHYDEYAYGERSAGNWLFELLSDATAPTS